MTNVWIKKLKAEDRLDDQEDVHDKKNVRKRKSKHNGKEHPETEVYGVC